jgi:hypothetical protein
MLLHVAFEITDVSEEPSASIIRMTRISELDLVVLIMKALCPSEASVFTRATRRNIPEDGILQIHPSFADNPTEIRNIFLRNRNPDFQLQCLPL